MHYGCSALEVVIWYCYSLCGQKLNTLRVSYSLIVLWVDYLEQQRALCFNVLEKLYVVIHHAEKVTEFFFAKNTVAVNITEFK